VPRSGLDAVEERILLLLPEFEPRFHSCRARSVFIITTKMSLISVDLIKSAAHCVQNGQVQEHSLYTIPRF
jgi:hypothetical protein